MKIGALVFLFVGLTVELPTCTAQVNTKPELFARQNLVAWCVVPYDKMERTPSKRSEMLKDLGITQLAWDWRQAHLPLLQEEIRALRKNNIKLKSVWFWVEGNAGETLEENHHYILKTLKENNANTELWVSFNDRFFSDLSDEAKLEKAVRFIKDLNEKANAIGCTVHLYNHGSWFGEPENQIRIIQETGAKNIGMVYNFHHAGQQVSRFHELLKMMMPFLSTVNINGVKDGGPMILTVGQGEYERRLLKILKESGYTGSIGILGHVEDEDAKTVLKRNLDGLKIILAEMGEKSALKTYTDY